MTKLKSDLVSAIRATPCSDVRRNSIGWQMLTDFSSTSGIISASKTAQMRKAVKAVQKRCSIEKRRR